MPEEYKDFTNGDTQNFAESYFKGDPLDYLIKASEKFTRYLKEYKRQGFVFVTKNHSLHNEVVGFTATIYGIELKKNEDGKPWKEIDDLKLKLETKEEEIKQLKKQIEERNK
mgnify:CR=1 FL=1